MLIHQSCLLSCLFNLSLYLSFTISIKNKQNQKYTLDYILPYMASVYLYNCPVCVWVKSFNLEIQVQQCWGFGQCYISSGKVPTHFKSFSPHNYTLFIIFSYAIFQLNVRSLFIVFIPALSPITYKVLEDPGLVYDKVITVIHSALNAALTRFNHINHT